MSETIKTQHVVKIAKSGTGQVLTPEQAAKIMGVDLANEPDFSEEYAQLIEAERERDEWRSRCESLEATWLSAQAECVQLREALALAKSMILGGEKMTPKTEAQIDAALSSAGRDLLERLRLLEVVAEAAKGYLDAYEAIITGKYQRTVPEAVEIPEWTTLVAAIDAYLKRGEKDA